MTKVRLVHADHRRSYAFVLVPERHVPTLLKQGDKMFVLRNVQGERFVFEETEFLEAHSEDDIEFAKQNGLLT